VEEALLLGEPEVISYGDLQAEIGRLLDGETWKTREIPKTLAKAGAWVQQDLLGEDSFIRPWMIDITDDHYAIDISRAGRLLGRKPEHSLRETLPRMIAALKADPVAGIERTNSTQPRRQSRGQRHGRNGAPLASASGFCSRPSSFGRRAQPPPQTTRSSVRWHSPSRSSFQ
jgi:hypothetical protein